MKIPHWKIVIIPLLIWGIGFILNAAVMARNGGQMPVLDINCPLYPMQGDFLHKCFTSSTRLKPLTDWIRIPGSGFWSPGDILMTLTELSYGFCLGMWVTLLSKGYREL